MPSAYEQAEPQAPFGRAEPARRTARGGAPRTRRWRRTGELAFGYALLAPAVGLLVVFELYPLLYGLYISACDWRLGCVEFVGLQNYARALGDSAVWQSLLTTATYSVIAVPVQLSLSLLLAYLLFQNVRGRE